MTEKRFTVNDRWIKDNHSDTLLNIDFATIIDANLCCDLLNQLQKKADKFFNDNNQLELKLERYEMIMGEYDISDFDELETIIQQGIGV